MAGREYFSLRYAVPGYTFILVFMLINYLPLVRIIQELGIGSFFGAFLGFLSLLTGSALGFLICQIWWLWFNKYQNMGGIKGLEWIPDYVIEKFKLETLDPNDKKGKDDLFVLLDFILNVNGGSNRQNLWAYIQKRMDMYIILSTTYLTLGSGLILGILSRLLYFERVIFGSSIVIRLQQNYLQVISEPEVLVQTFVIGIVILLMFIMRWERKYTIANYSSFIKAIINDLSEDSNSVEKIKKAFPDYFRKKQSPQMNTQIHNHREDKNPEDEPET